MFDEKFESLSDEAMSLRITEKFLIEIERSLLRDSAPAFDVSTIKEHLKFLNPKSENQDEARCEAAADALRSEFEHWRSLLVERDEAIETFHVRRFCDSARMSLNTKIFQSLTRFYRSVELTPNSQSKFDLMSTRAFASECRGRMRPAQYDRDETCEQLRLLYLDWNETQIGLFCDQEKVDEAVDGFDAFLSEARKLSAFEGLIESDIFDRLRAFKKDLGTNIFAPECAAAAIECNVTVGRIFDSLMVVANSNLNQRLGEKIDFAGALLDGSLEGGALVDLFAGLIKEPVDAFKGNTDMAVLRSLLKRTEAVQTEAVDASEGHESDEQPTETETPSVKQRIAAELETISNASPDTELLRTYMSRSPVLDVLDLNDYLFDAKGEPDVLGRRALASILCLEEFKDNELSSHKPLDAEVNDELVAMLDFAERIGKELSESLKVTEQASQNRMLVVMNSLLSSRLQVERAVVRYAVPAPEPVQPEPKDEAPSNPIPFEITRAPLSEANRFLMAATALVVAVCGGMLLFGGGSYAMPVPQDVDQITVSTLPGHKHIEEALQKGDTLYVNAKDSWSTLSDKERRDLLAEMGALEFKKPVSVITVIGPNSQPFGEYSAGGVNLYGADGNVEEPSKY